MPRKLIKVYSRRQFISTAAASTLAFNYLPRRIWGANDRLRFAGIGVGGKGSSDIDHAGKLGDVAAICDIDEARLQTKAGQFTQARKFYDFREMLERMENEIDAVTISTADHTHAPAAAMAMRMGKHVYVQKPLTHTVREARLLTELARRHKVATQMGNQGTAADGFRQAIEVVQSGVIGQVREVHVWTNRPVWPQAPDITARPEETPSIPAHVNWDLFLGPAPWRPYHRAYHPFNWRGWWDFGTGALGDMACHTANMAFMALKLGHPISVSAENGPLNPETFPAWATITFEFPARWELAPVKFVWYEGKFQDGAKNLPPAELFHGEEPPGSGSLLVGDKGILYSPNDYGAQFILFPKNEFQGYQPPAPWLPRNGKGDLGMKEEWVAAIKGGRPAFSNFDYAGLLTETILLGNVAMLAGRKIEWDGPNLRSPNCPEAAHFVTKEYRRGWDPERL
jgi:predicted dehydrogenase